MYYDYEIFLPQTYYLFATKKYLFDKYFLIIHLLQRNISLSQIRHEGCSRRETLPHILGFCEKGELLRNKRHNDSRTIIAKHLRKNDNYNV